jgi:hypothetical protein
MEIEYKKFFLFIFLQMTFYFSSLFCAFRDAPVAWQMYFQDPATSVMEGISDLNADIHFFLVVI